MSKFCTQCGAQLNDNAAFCTGCGAKIESKPKQQENNSFAGVVQTGGNVWQPNNVEGEQQTNNAYGQNPQQTGMPFSGNAQQTNGQTPFNQYYSQPAGMQTNNPQQAANNFYAQNLNNGGATSGSSKKTLLIAGFSIIALIIVGILCFFLFFRSTYKTPVDNLMKVVNNGSGSALEQLVPKAYRNVIEDLGMELSEYYDKAAEEIRQEMEDELGKDYKITYEIESKNPMKLSEMQKYAEEFNNYSSAQVKVTEGYELDISLIAKTKDSEEKDSTILYVGKVDGDWCILNFDSFM